MKKRDHCTRNNIENRFREQKTYREVASARDHRAVFQVMGFCVVTCKQPAEKEKQRQVKLPPQHSKCNTYNKECEIH